MGQVPEGFIRSLQIAWAENGSQAWGWERWRRETEGESREQGGGESLTRVGPTRQRNPDRQAVMSVCHVGPLFSLHHVMSDQCKDAAMSVGNSHTECPLISPFLFFSLNNFLQCKSMLLL